MRERLDRARGELELELPVRFVLWVGAASLSRVHSPLGEWGEGGGEGRV